MGQPAMKLNRAFDSKHLCHEAQEPSFGTISYNMQLKATIDQNVFRGFQKHINSLVWDETPNECRMNRSRRKPSVLFSHLCQPPRASWFVHTTRFGCRRHRS